MKKKKQLINLPIDVVILLLKINKSVFVFFTDLMEILIGDLKSFEENTKKRTVLYRFLIILIFILLITAIVTMLAVKNVAAKSLILIISFAVVLVAYLFSRFLKRNDL